MSVLVFLEFNNNELKETSKQALTYANDINENVYDNNDETNDNGLKSSKNGKCNTIKGNWIVLSLILIIMIMVIIIYNVV